MNRYMLEYIYISLLSWLSCSYAEAVDISCYVLLSMRAVVIAPYMVLSTSLRYHLFVWTVFSPKLLYEAMLTSVVSLLTLTVSLAFFILPRSRLRRTSKPID